MVRIGVVGVGVAHGFMVVGVAVRFEGVNAFVMFVQMVYVVMVGVQVGMAVRGMCMQVRVVFRQVQPHACAHQQAGCQHVPRYGLAEQRNRQGCADKWRY